MFFAKNWMSFKEEYVKQDKSGGAQEGDVIKVRLGERNELRKESLLDFASNAGLYSEEHIKYLDEHLQDNAWLIYFGKISIPGRNWIDFEAEIERALNQVELFYSNLLPCSY